MHATKVSHICPFVDIFWTQEDLFKKNNDSTFCRSLTISTLDKQEQNDIRSICTLATLFAKYVNNCTF